MFALALAAAALAASPGSSAASCPTGAQCATITVPLDHSGAVAGTLPLAYARVPATGSRTGTLVLLSGGPGQPAIPLTAVVTKTLEPLREHYDLVFVDQRGTGRSGAVACTSTTSCVTALGARRAFYNTPETARDLENLRVALGVPQLTLLGVSYGTKVAQEYVRRFPAQTAAVILDSPTPVDGLDGVSVLPEVGAPRVLTEACTPGACRESLKDPAAALTAAAKRLRKHSISGPLVSPTGHVKTETVTEAELYALLSASDLAPDLQSGLPAAIASLAAGDAAPLLHLVELTGGSLSGTSGGVNLARALATTCIEGRLPWAPDSPLAGRLDALKAYVETHVDAFSPFSPATVLGSSAAGLCLDWPPTPAPEPVGYPGPNVPVLILSGRQDLRTPTEDARRTLAQYPNGKLLTVPGVGHSVLSNSSCALAGVVAFLAGQPVDRCSRELQRLSNPYLPATVGALRPTRLAGLAGRTVTGVALTFTSFAIDLFANLDTLVDTLHTRRIALPGLRSGYLDLNGESGTFHHYEVFRGLVIDGSFKSDSGTLTISGPDAAPGVLTLKGDTLSGTIGGQRVTVPESATNIR